MENKYLIYSIIFLLFVFFIWYINTVNEGYLTGKGGICNNDYNCTSGSCKSNNDGTKKCSP
jgi:hypothetical protein